jgi:hypothetical protein
MALTGHFAAAERAGVYGAELATAAVGGDVADDVGAGDVDAGVDELGAEVVLVPEAGALGELLAAAVDGLDAPLVFGVVPGAPELCPQRGRCWAALC